MKEGKNNEFFRLFRKKTNVLQKSFNLKFESHGKREDRTMQGFCIYSLKKLLSKERRNISLIQQSLLLK